MKDKEENLWEEYKKLPRYCVGLQKPDDLVCYKDFHECNALSEAKKLADERAASTGRATIVFDRHETGIIYKVEAKKLDEKPVVEEVAASIDRPERKAPKKVKRK